MIFQVEVLHADWSLRGGAAVAGLELPFEEVEEQNVQLTDQFPLFTLCDALNFLGDVLNVRLRQFAGAQQCYLLIRPGVEIFVLEVGGHAPFPTRPARGRGLAQSPPE